MNLCFKNLAKTVVSSVLVCGAISSVSCKPRASQSENENGGASTETFGLKKEYRWDKLTLSVCWLNSNPYYNDYKANIRKAVEANVHKSVFRTTGWGNCDLRKGAEAADVTIFIYDDPTNEKDKYLSAAFERATQDKPDNPGIERATGGKVFSSRPYRMVLNAEYQKGRTPASATKFNSLTAKGKKSRVTSAAVHEFGHILGLEHEHMHEEAECHVKFGETADKYAEEISPYNENSAMNYCVKRDFDKQEYGFNKKDIEAINKMYAHLTSKK